MNDLAIPFKPGWHARLQLQFRLKNGKTIFDKRANVGPLVVQKPFYPESAKVCHVYVLHPPGGLVGGDKLELFVQVDARAHALMTTPAATKCYRSLGPWQQIDQTIHVANEGRLEWLPQETIVYPDAQVKLRTKIQLGSDSRFLGWEILNLGLAASSRPFDTGFCQQHFEVWRGDKPIWLERTKINGSTKVMSATWGLNGNPVIGTFICVDNESYLAQVRKCIDTLSIKGVLAATRRQGVLIVRYHGKHAYEARNSFIQIWKALRLALFGYSAHEPRIWKT